MNKYSTPTTADNLNERTPMNDTFTIKNGELLDSEEYAPDVEWLEGSLLVDSSAWATWSDNRTGQYGYNGPVMHSSEYLGGGMARDLLAEDGTYAVCEVLDVSWHCPACGELSDYCQGHGDSGDPEGFAIVEAHDSGDHSDCDLSADCSDSYADNPVGWVVLKLKGSGE